MGLAAGRAIGFGGEESREREEARRTNQKGGGRGVERGRKRGGRRIRGDKEERKEKFRKIVIFLEW